MLVSGQVSLASPKMAAVTNSTRALLGSSSIETMKLSGPLGVKNASTAVKPRFLL